MGSQRRGVQMEPRTFGPSVNYTRIDSTSTLSTNVVHVCLHGGGGMRVLFHVQVQARSWLNASSLVSTLIFERGSLPEARGPGYSWIGWPGNSQNLPLYPSLVVGFPPGPDSGSPAWSADFTDQTISSALRSPFAFFSVLLEHLSWVRSLAVGSWLAGSVGVLPPFCPLPCHQSFVATQPALPRPSPPQCCCFNYLATFYRKSLCFKFKVYHVSPST